MAERALFMDPELYGDETQVLRRPNADPEETACIANLAGLAQLSGEERLVDLIDLSFPSLREAVFDRVGYTPGHIRFTRALGDLTDDEGMHLQGWLADVTTEQWEGFNNGSRRLRTVADIRHYQPRKDDPSAVYYLKRAVCPPEPIVGIDIL